MAKNLAAFCLCHQELTKPEFKERYELPSLAQEVSRQEGMQSVAWLLLAALGKGAGLWRETEQKGKKKNC